MTDAIAETQAAVAPHGADYAEIAAVLGEYFDGLYHSDTTRLRRVFHPRAVYATAAGDAPLILDLDGWMEVVRNRTAPASRNDARTDRIVSIDFAGPTTAVAKVRCSIRPRHFVDLLTFIRVDGRWQVIAKAFHFDVEPGAA